MEWLLEAAEESSKRHGERDGDEDDPDLVQDRPGCGAQLLGHRDA